jgi:hypothetical protein
VDGTSFGRDDDEDQHSDVLWPSYRKVGAKEPVERERKDEKHSLWERPRVRHCGSAHAVHTVVPGCVHEMRNHSKLRTETDQSNL